MSGYSYHAARFLAVIRSAWTFLLIWIKGAVLGWPLFDSLMRQNTAFSIRS